jgi:hypothetical protein
MKKRALTVKKSESKQSLDVADSRFEPVAKALARSPGFSLMENKSKSMRGMMREGKSFGMSSHGRFVVKLNEARVAELIADGTGEPFRSGATKVMKGWLEVIDPEASWVKLAKEAYSLAGAATKPLKPGPVKRKR